MPAAHREGDRIIVPVPADASRVHAKGVGTALPGGGLSLHPVEAAHAVETGRIELAGGLEGLLEDFPGHEAAYLAYRDLRERGLVVRAGDGWDVWQRGRGPPAAPWFTMHPAGERDPARVADLAAWAADGAVVSLVDEDGGVTHYTLSRAAPQGGHAAPDMPRVAAAVLQDRVLVAAAPGVEALRRAGLGTAVGERQAISFAEATYLREAGVLDVPDLSVPAAARQHHYTRTQPVDADLRARGVLPKSGFRFGTHLRAYARGIDESHADWLVQCVFPDDALHWSEVSRAVRLAHGVRKQVLLGVVGDPVIYVALSWFRP